MLGNILPPYHSLQELNLDWILTKVRDMLRFLPDDGTVGQILRRTAHGAEWSNEQGGGGGAVNSVNGQTGDVVLTAADVGALPDSTVIPENTSDLNNDSGFVDAAGAAAAAPVQSVAGKTGTVTLVKGDVGLGNVDNVQQYSASNPPPYPVTSVNSQTGAVVLAIPSKTSDLNNDSGFVDAAGAAAAAPVQSVNGLTGAVVLNTDSMIMGTMITFAVDISTSGMRNTDVSALSTPASIAGYTFRFWIFRSATYRATPINVSGGQRFYYYVGTTGTTANMEAFPIYEKD